MSESGDPPVFDPPASRSFEPEFFPSVPRPVPDAALEGGYARRQRGYRNGLLAWGAACLVLARFAFVQRLSAFLLPLGYLDLIGVALLLGAAAVAARTALRRGTYRYLIEGIPIVARVASLQKVPFVRINGQDSTYGFAAALQVRHPDTGELQVLVVKSREFPAALKDRYDTPLRVGQYATAVYLPGKFEKTLNLYGFLELNPELQFVVDAGEGDAALRRRRLWALLALCGVFGVVLGDWYAFDFLGLVNSWEPALLRPSLALGAVLGGAIIFYLWKRSREEGARIRERNRSAAAEGRALEPSASGVFGRTGFRGGVLRVVLTLFAMLSCAATISSGLLAFNALLDRSPAELRPVRIDGLEQTTYDFLFRAYGVQYGWEGSAAQREFALTPDQLSDFFVGDEHVQKGFAEVHRGRLGWPWIKNVLPGVEEVRRR
jgi:hypothetical protein